MFQRCAGVFESLYHLLGMNWYFNLSLYAENPLYATKLGRHK